jgi:hypothetical protein
MTSNSNPKPQPTAPGWWWVKDRRGRIMAVEIAMHEGELCMLTSTMYPWPVSATNDEWLGPALSHDEVQQLRQRIADLEAQQAQWDGPVQSRAEAYKRHVMGVIDGETAKPLTKEQHKDLRRLQNYYADSAMALLDESVDMSKAHHNIARNILDAINAAYAYEAIRDKINEKAGAQ